MKVLLYGINFAPEPTGIGKYSAEMVEWLASRGVECRVLCAPPYYPAWVVPPNYSAWRSTRERFGAVQVWRAPLWVPSNPTGLRRVVHLLSFAVCSIPALLRQTLWVPDVVIVIAPAMACAPAGWLAARLCGAKAWLHIQDFEVDAAFRLGVLKGRWAQWLALRFERAVLRRFDRVSTISQRMAQMLATKDVDERHAVLFPNWVDVAAIRPSASQGRFRAELGIAPDAVVALFSGSMSGKQGLELLRDAARVLEPALPGLVFVLCGDGVFKPTLERDCQGLSNVRTIPLQPSARLGELLTMADIHLLPQQAGAADLVMPSKLCGMLASGRPVLATARSGTELARVVSGRGLLTPPDDLDAFVDALTTLVASPDLRERLGDAARRYAEEHLARDRVLSDLLLELKGCVLGLTPRRAVPDEPAASALGDPPVKTV